MSKAERTRQHFSWFSIVSFLQFLQTKDKREKETKMANPLTPPDRPFTAPELLQFNGAAKPEIYISVKGIVFDVTSGSDFYGPGKSYNKFAGREASRCLGKMQVDDSESNASWLNLNPEHMKTLDEWFDKYSKKYPVVGYFKKDDHFEVRGSQLEP
jgi:membrane-associated progesterone receptor component